MSCSPKLLLAAFAFIATAAHAQVIGIATLVQGSLYYSVIASVASVLQAKAGIPARVQPMSGASTYAPLVNRGELEFGIMNSIDVINAVKGVENFNGRRNSDIRLVGVLFSLPVGMAVAHDSSAKSIRDLKGLRAPSQFAAQTTMVMVQDALLATGGLSHRDMKPFPVPDSIKGTYALGDGKVDTAIIGVGNSAAQEVHIALGSHGGLRFLPITDTPEGLAAMKKVMPSAYPKLFQPSPATPGIVAPTMLMAYSALLVTSTHVPDELVYKVTKALYENKAALEAASAAMKSFDPKLMLEPSEALYHPGAEKFYREIGEWPPKKR